MSTAGGGGMGLAAAASRRWLWRHPGQLALTVLGVALGVAVVVALDLAIQSAREAFRVSTETVSGRATHRITGGPGGLPAALFTRLATGEGPLEAAPVVEGWASTERLPGTALRLLGVDPFSERPFRPFLSGGAGPASDTGEPAATGGSAPSGPAATRPGTGLDVAALLTRPGAVVLAEATAARAGLRPGDRFELVVDGRARDALLAGVLAPADDLARRGLADLVVADIATAQALTGRTDGHVTAIELRIPAGPGGEATLARVRAALPPDAVLQPVGARAEAMEGMLRAFDLNLTALSLLALVFGMFLIYNATTFSVVQRRGLLGTLRTLGVTRRQVAVMVGLESLVTAAVGTLLGVGAGVLMGRGLVRLVTRTINDLYFVLSVEGLRVPPEALLKGVLVGVGATLLAAVPALREATGSTPRTAMTRSMVEERVSALVPRAAALGLGLQALGAALLLMPSRSVTLSFAGLFGVLLGLALLTPLATVGAVRLLTPLLGRTVGILGTMAARGVSAALSRTAPAAAALVVAVAVTVGLGVMIQSFRITVEDWLGYTLQADVYVSPPSPVSSRAEGSLDPDLVERLASAPVVDGVSTYRGTELVTERYGPVRVVGLELDPRGEAAFRFLGAGSEDAFRAFRGRNAVLVSEPFAFRHGLARGDSLVLRGRQGTRSFPVAGVFTDYGSDQGVVMMARSTWDILFDDPRVTSLGLFLAPGVEADEAVAALRERAGAEAPVVIRSNQDLREASLRVFDRTFAITGVLRALAFAVAFVGVLSALMALQLERARELGVLRANGLTPGQVWVLVTTQTGVLGLVAGVLAVPAGLVLAMVMIFVVNRRSFGWTLGMEVGGDVVLQAVGLAVAGALLAGLYPAWRMARTSPALALREE